MWFNIAAKELGIELKWNGHGINEKGYDVKTGKQIVSVDSKYFRPTEVETLIGDPSKAKDKLGWVPKVSFDELVSEMVSADFESAKRDLLCKTNGFEVNERYE